MSNLPPAHPANFPDAVTELFTCTAAVYAATNAEYVIAATRLRDAQRFLALFVSASAVAELNELAIAAREHYPPVSPATWSADAIAHFDRVALERDPSLHTYDGPPPEAVRDEHGATLAQPFTWYED